MRPVNTCRTKADASMAAHPKLVQRPLDPWTLRERLLLASAVLQSGDQNWVSVSRAIKNLSTEIRSADYFSQKNCALQYGHLLENAETPKRKRSEKNEVIPVETQGHQIVSKLKLEYMEQVVRDIKRQQEEYQKLADEIEMVDSGHCDEKLSEIWGQIQRKQNVKQEAEASVSLSQSETSIENEQTLSSLTTSLPDADDTSTQDSQEADIEVDDHNEEAPSFTDAINSSLSSQPVASAPTESVEKQRTPIAESNFLPSADTDLEQSEVVETTEVVATDELVEEDVIDSEPETVPEDITDTTTTAAAATDVAPVPTVVESVSLSTADAAGEETPEPSLAKSSTEDSNDSIVEKVPELSESKSRTKLRQTSKSRQLSETSTHEDISVDDDVMPRPAKVPSPVRLSNAIVGDKPTSQLTISVIPAEIEQAMSPESTISSASDVKCREPTTPTNSSSANRRRSSRVVKQKDDKKEETASVGATKTASESELASDDEEGVANTSKVLDVTPASPTASQQSEPDDDRHRKLWKKTLMMIWKNISQHKYANVFMDQVTDEIAPGYSACVHRPMSLSTIKYNLEKNITKTTDEFVRDVMLMFVNAMMCNNHEYDVYVMAQEMYDEAMKTIEQHTQYIGKESDLKMAGSRGRRSETSSSVDKEVDKGRRRSSADQHSDNSQSAAKKRKTRADD